MSDFLPEGYSVPEAQGGYTKFQKGENRFRVLGPAILGYEYWVTDKEGKRKPKRVRMNDQIDQGDIEDTVKHFWAFPVYNFDTKEIQIMNVTQKGIMKAIKALAQNPKWGNPTKYNLVITKEGDGLETTYQVQPEPKDDAEEALLNNVRIKFNEMEINMEEYYVSKQNPYGGNPFGGEKQDSSSPAETEVTLDPNDLPF